MTETRRMYLLRNLDVHYDSCLITQMKHWLNSYEIDHVCSPPTRIGRAKAFIDLLSRKLTNNLFINFLIGLGDKPRVRQEIFLAYRAEGGAPLHIKNFKEFLISF